MFDYTIQVLFGEIEKLKTLNQAEKIEEIRAVIGMIRDGQGYLTNTKPVKVIFYSEL